MSKIAERELRELPLSGKLVFKTLEYADATLTQKALVEESRLSQRTVRYAFTDLKEIEAVEEDINFADARQSLYSISGSHG